MAITIRANTGQETSGGSPTTLTSNNITPVAGDALVVCVGGNFGGQSVSGISDTLGSSYSVIAAATVQDGNNGNRSEIWWTKNVAGGVRTVTVTLTAAAFTGWSFEVFDVVGINSASVLGATAVFSTSQTGVFAGPSLNGGPSNALYIQNITGTDGSYLSVGSPWTIADQFLNSGQALADLVGVGTQQATFTASMSRPFFGVIGGVAFAQAASGWLNRQRAFANKR